jgi:hypothetical protein
MADQTRERGQLRILPTSAGGGAWRRNRGHSCRTGARSKPRKRPVMPHRLFTAKGHAFRKFRWVLSRRNIMRIAQRFNPGTGQFCVAPVPEGRLNPSSAERVPFRPALGRLRDLGSSDRETQSRHRGTGLFSNVPSGQWPPSGARQFPKGMELRRHLQKEPIQPIQPIQPIEHLPFRPEYAKVFCV